MLRAIFWCIFCFALHAVKFIFSRCGVSFGFWHKKLSLNITPSILRRIFVFNIRTHPLIVSPSPSYQKIDPPKLVILQISVNNSKSYSRAGHGGNCSRWKLHNKKIRRLNKSWNISMETKNIPENKGWKFLKKLWCCVGGGNKVISLYQLSWKCKLATAMSYKADVSSVSPSSEQMEGLWVVYGFIWRKWSYAIGWNIVTRKTWIN